MIDGVQRCVAGTRNPSVLCHLKKKINTLDSQQVKLPFFFFSPKANKHFHAEVFVLASNDTTVHPLTRFLFVFRNTKSTSSSPRRGRTAGSDTTARWRNWLWTATWSDLFGSRTPSSGTPRTQIPTGLQCPTSCSGYGTTGRYFTP